MDYRKGKQQLTPIEIGTIVAIAALLIVVSVNSFADVEFAPHQIISKGQQKKISTIALNEYYEGSLAEGERRTYYLTSDGNLLHHEPSTSDYAVFAVTVTDGRVMVENASDTGTFVIR